MKTKYSVVGSTLLLCTTILTVGCGGGGGGGSSGSSGGSNNGPGGGGVVGATTIVSGTTGAGSTGTTSSSTFASQAAPTATTDTVAVLRVDKNGDGLLDENDYVYTIPVLNDGSFTFENVAVDATKPTKAQLSVVKEGFAPVVKTVTLTKDTPLSIFADVSNTPVLTEVVKLPETKAGRANIFLKFGVTSDANGLSSFSKLMSLSELKAEADVPLGDGTLTTASIPASAFDSKVKSVTVQMQAFDSTKAKDIAHFPGTFSGHGKPAIGTTTTSEDDEVALESAAFDLIALTDQNGEAIELQNMPSSKLSGQANAASCSGMYWVRHVTSSQAAVIEAWGDDDNTTDGFQVPIWSNDNATGSWQYVGEALWTPSGNAGQFEMCVAKKWEGYLNCDSQINVGGKPTELCLYVNDQFGNAVDGLSFTAQNGNSYSSSYLYNGKATLDLAKGTPADWNVSYKGAWTSWNSVAVDSSKYDKSTTAGCDYDLNVTVDNPYSAQVYVFAVNDANQTVPNAYVTLQNFNYQNYYNRGAYTNTKGYAIFKVKPNVNYTAGYIAGSAAVNVNGSVAAPETADSGKYASVDVKNENVAPNVSIRLRSRVTDRAESMPFSIAATDRNQDTLTLDSFKVQNSDLREGVDYNVTNRISYAGYLYVSGMIDLNSTTLQGISPSSLGQGNYTFKASVSDGKSSVTSSTTVNVKGNRAPVVGSLYLVDTVRNNYYENSAIPAGDYSLNYYVYDPDGDPVNKTMTLDGVDYTPGNSVTLNAGDHNITISASDGKLTATDETHIYVGNHAPVISSARATSYLIDINKGDTFKLYAFVSDAENDALTVTAVDDANVTHILSKVGSYGTKYESSDIKLTQAKAANNYTIIANDGESNSTAVVVSVESIAANQPPIFTKELTDKQVNVNETQNFECVAEDPEGTLVSYTWKVNGKERSETGTTFSRTFTATGSNTVSCTATDEDGKSATSSATILVVDPTQSGTLTVHAKYKGLLVSLHDANLKVTTKKFTDANGVATFNVTGDRTTFSITAWPGMEVYKDLTMDMIKPQIIYEAQNACENNTSTECTTTDWCALLNADTIPTWVWDMEIDDANNKPTAATIDTNSDGSISQDELYAAALKEFDTNKGNNDGHLSYEELKGNIGYSNEKSTIEEIYTNVPVRDYYITLDALNRFYGGMEYNIAGCQSGVAFRSEVSVDYTSLLSSSATSSSANKDVSIQGSGYGGAYNKALDENNTVTVPVRTYSLAKNGKYTYLVRENDSGTSEYNFYLLADKTKAEMDANVTLNAADFKAADKNVSFVNSDTNSVSLFPSYQGIELWGSEVYVDDNDGDYKTYTRKYFTHSGIYYTIRTSGSQHDNEYGSYNYYGDGTLQNSYDASNYPALDVTFTLNTTDNTWTLQGSDMSKLNYVGAEFRAGVYRDENGTTVSRNFTLSTYWTVAPSQSPQKMVLKDIVPSEAFADANASIDESNGWSDFGVEAEEFKGLSEDAFINAIAGNSSTSQTEEKLYEKGVRSVRVGAMSNPYSSTSAEESKKTYNRSGMFKLRLFPSGK